MEMTIPFGQLLPDQPDYKNPGVISAVNVIPRTNSFSPMRRPSVISNALSARVHGAISVRNNDGDIYVYAGDTSKLYEMVDNSFTDESKAGGYALPVGDVWEFTPWHPNNAIIATNYNNPIQYMAIGGGAAGAFADLITSTNKPKAKHMAGVGRFLVLGNTNDSTDGNRSARVWWSAINDAQDFDPATSTQCDFEDLSTGGSVQRIYGGADYGLIFQTDMVRPMRYAGAGVVFEIQPLAFTPGTPLPTSVVSYKGFVFYIAEDGFMALHGTQVQHIGTGRIDKYFWEQFDIANKRSVSSAVDPINKLVCWAFPGSDSTGGVPNRIVMCKYDEMKWSEVEIDVEWILAGAAQGYTLDSLDDVGTDIDDSAVFDAGFDSEKWKGGAARFSAFNQSHQLCTFTGPTLAATIVTGDVQPAPGRNWSINAVRPLVDGGDVSISVASKTKLRDAVSYGSISSMDVQGECHPPIVDAKYHRCRTSLSASTSWDHIQGLSIEYVMRGVR